VPVQESVVQESVVRESVVQESVVRESVVQESVVRESLLREYPAGRSDNEHLTETIGQYTSYGIDDCRHLTFYRHRLRRFRLDILHRLNPQDIHFLDELLYSVQ
jgi:hypothetical protein